MNWKEFLKQVSRDFRISEAEIAEITGITYPTLNRIGRGVTSKPNQHTIKKLESGLNIKIDDSDPEDISFAVVPPVVRETPNKYEISETITKEDFAILQRLRELGITNVERLDQIFDIEDLAEDIKEVIKKKLLKEKK